MQVYSDPSRENEKWALPDVEVFQLTARECAEMDQDRVREWMRKHEYRLASMNGKVQEKMFDAMIEQECIEGGWFFHYCFPGCLPDSDPFGPYPTAQAAKDAAIEMTTGE